MFVETFNETTTRPMIFVIEKFVTTMREKLYIYIYIYLLLLLSYSEISQPVA